MISQNNKYLLTDLQMAEFVAKGFLIFENLIDNKTNLDFLKEIGHTPPKKKSKKNQNLKKENTSWLMEGYNDIMKTSSIPLVKAGTPLSKAYNKNSALKKIISNPILDGAINSLVGW